MKKPPAFAILLVLTLLVLIAPGALGDPESYIEETLNAEFFMNGTLKAEPERLGYVSVSVGNNQDVLQYVETNTSWSDRTNLEIIPGTEGDEKVRAHRSTAASPVLGDEKTRLYLNTTDSDASLFYTISESVAPLINVSMDYVNEDGGVDIHSSLNTLNFTLEIESDEDLPGSELEFQVDESLAGADAMNIINDVTTSGSTAREDTDFDGTYDKLMWSGDLYSGTPVTISFEGQIQPGVNFDSSLYTYLDLEGYCQAEYTGDETFSGITFENRFSRGPLRQGIDLIDDSNWYVQGFIKNMAMGIYYAVEGWEIYEVGQETPMRTSSDSFMLEPGEAIYTERVDTGGSEKKYYSSSFNWKILWGSSHYSGISTSNIDMPYLYLIESFLDKTVNLNSNDEGERSVTVRESVTHVGDPSLNVDIIGINSTIPHLSQEGYPTIWTIGNIEVLYRSGGNETDITALAHIASAGSTGEEDGYVNVTVTSSDLGYFMELGDQVILSYDLSSPAKSVDSTYWFGLETVLVTESGTPDYQTLSESISITGIGEPGGPGGGGGGGPEDAWIQIEDSEAYVIVGNLAEVDVTYRIYDTGGKGIRNIELVVYIPENGEMLEERTFIEIFINDEWKKLLLGEDYLIRNRGIVTVGEKRYRQYLVDFLLGTGELNLYDDDKIRIKYQSELPYGLNELITEARGYNYYRDKIVSESVHSLIRIGVKVSKFEYVKEDWVQGLALVGRPVGWIREFKVKNPNDVAAEDSFETRIFSDALTAYIITEDGKTKKLNIMPDNKVSWGIRLEANEETIVFLKITTPPVLETRRIIIPLIANETWVNFDMNSTVENFANEAYRNVTYTLSFPMENILYYEGIEELKPDGNDTSAILGYLIPGENRSFYIRYIQKPPVLIVTTNGFNFTREENLEVGILVIPTEREERGYIELEATGPVEKTRKTVYGDVMEVEGLKGSINEFNRTIGLDTMIPGDYKISTYFKKDFMTVLNDEKTIHISGEKLLFEIGYHLLLLIFIVFLWFMFTRIERKKDEFREELRMLRNGRIRESKEKGTGSLKKTGIGGINEIKETPQEKLRIFFRKLKRKTQRKKNI